MSDELGGDDAEQSEIRRRIEKLGFECPRDLKTDQLEPAVLALACMPMYYVAVILEIKDDEELPESATNDIFGVHHLRELMATSEATGSLQLNSADERQLRSLLVNRRPIDSIIYDFAIETLRKYLNVASPEVAEPIRAMIARTMVSVAHASGDGWFGAGSRATPEQVALIQKIAASLGLEQNEAAASLMKPLENG